MAMPRVNVRLNDDLYDRLTKAAKGRGYRISRLVRDLLASGLDDNRASAVMAAEERISATLDRFAKDIRRLHTADQALYALRRLRYLRPSVPDLHSRPAF
jgi:metal-responsive CopG/Arc/MetJ family transcriptional regulator